MSDKIQLIAHVYMKAVKLASDDPGKARSAVCLVPDGNGGLKAETKQLIGPRVKIGLMGSRDFSITDTGHVLVATHKNNPAAVKTPWLELLPAWGKVADPNGGTVDVLKGIFDVNGGKVAFQILDDMIEG